MYQAGQDDGKDLAAINHSSTSSKVRNGWTALFTFTAKAHLLALVPATLLSLTAGVLQPAMAIFFGKFFDAFSEYGGGKTNGAHLMQKTLIDVYALIGLGVATWLLKGGYFASWLMFGEMQAQSVRDELFKSLLQKDVEWYEARTTGVGALLSRLETQIRELQIGTSQPLGFTLNYAIQGVVSLGLAFFYSWKLTLVALAGIPVAAFVLSLLSRNLQSSIACQHLENAKASKAANNAISNFITVKCFNTQDLECRRYSRSVWEAATFYFRQAKTNALQIGFMRFAATAMFAQGFWYGGHLIDSGEITAGKVITAFWACLVATKAFEDILPHIIVLEKGQAAAVALRSILNRVASGQESSIRHDATFPEYCEGDIEIRDVSFAYPSRPDHFVLDGATFFFPAGETTFVVGKSGSGKSTVSSLLMRFYGPERGTILIDGDRLHDLSMSWLRNNMTLVQQQTILFNETILRNIAFGHRDHEHVTCEHVKPSLELAMLQSTLNELPEGLNSLVGASGSALSGGQKQRVAIARSRLRDTPILILDESTSALDYTSRTAVMENIRRWRQDKTTIIITHDLSQIQETDFVYVLENGSIVAEGYKPNLSAHLEHELHQSGAEIPTVAKSGHFDFGWVPRPLTEDEAGESASGGKGRKDSIDVHLEATAESINLSEPISRRRTGRLSRALSIRLSRRPYPSFDTPKRDTISPDNTIIGGSAQPQPIDHLQRLRAPRSQLGRTMSMHQAMVMRSIYRQSPNAQKLLPSPAILGTPKASIRISVRKPMAQQGMEPPSIQRILRTVWPQLDYKNRRLLISGFTASLIHAAGAPIFSYILVRLFRTFYLKQSHPRLMYSMALLGVAVVDGTASFLMHYLLEVAGQCWVDGLRMEAMRRIMEQEKAWFDDSSNGATVLTSTLDRNAEEMRNLIGRFAAYVLVVAIMMTIAILWSVVTCWKLTLVGLAAAPVLYVLTKGFEVTSASWEGETNTVADEIGAVFAETFSDIRTVRALTLESYFHKKYTIVTSKAFAIGCKRAAYSGLFFGLSDSAINFVTALIFWFGAYLAKTNAYSVESILTTFSLLLFSTANANSLIAYIPQISSSADTAVRLLRLAQLPLRSHEYTGNHRLEPSGPTTLSGPIHFINLTFYYPTRLETPALHRLNLSISAGGCTAIVGPSGSGKSTIAALLLGLYPPTADGMARTRSDAPDGPPSLTISGRDIRTLHLPTLRSMIAIVPQVPVIFNATVRENITYGLDLNSDLTTLENVERAAKRAGIHEFILTLPGAYDTVIGDGGTGVGLGLSGGQSQRVVIARALVRKPKILILDEATSALDSENAQLVIRTIKDLVADTRIKRMAREKKSVLTVVIITHARAMMEGADNVVMLEQGRVVEEGDFQELERRRGKLWEMLGAGKGDR